MLWGIALVALGSAALALLVNAWLGLFSFVVAALLLGLAWIAGGIGRRRRGSPWSAGAGLGHGLSRWPAGELGDSDSDGGGEGGCGAGCGGTCGGGD